MVARQFKIYAPLQKFGWSGNTYELMPGLRVSRFDQKPDLGGLDTSLGEDEQNKIFYASHWLAFDWIEGAVPSPAETTNLVLLALWLVKPTKTHIAFRFQLDNAAAENWRHRLLDRFSWISGATHDDYTDTDLQVVSAHYRVLHDLCRARGRLNDALILTLAGCWSHRWQAALTRLRGFARRLAR